ncbi:MAG: hypothetical protein HKN46_00850 [Acidimicrobiia bacterium]|nr:hypothetical protein [Acidimicrobiia bacterium]
MREIKNSAGLGIALGAGAGAALFAATDNAGFIGVGIAVGVALASRRSTGRDEGPESSEHEVA